MAGPSILGLDSARQDTSAGRMRFVAVRDRIDRYFDISLYLLVAAGFATVAGTGKLDLASLLFVLAALAGRAYLLVKNEQATISERGTTYLTLLYIAFYPLDYLLLSGSFVTATVHLVLFAMVVKVFSVRRDRDYVYLAVLAFLEVLAASVLTVDTLFLAAFAVFLLLAVATFISMEMRRAGRRAGSHARESAAAARQLSWSLSVTTVALVAAILLGAVAIFFVLPRISGGYLGALSQRNELASGFSNEVNLGKIGEIKLLSAVVMHVQIHGDQRGVHDVKWRGVSLGLFDGTHWSNPPQARQTLQPHAGVFRLTAAYPPWEDWPASLAITFSARCSAIVC